MKVFSLSMLILGGFVGAGFASGREIAFYFSSYQKYSVIGIVVAVVVLFLLMNIFLFLSNYFDSFKSFIDRYFGKYSLVVNVLFAVVLLILVGAMFAGTIELSKELNFNKYLLVFITGICCYFVVVGSIKKIDKINKIFVPILCIGFKGDFSYQKTSIILSVFSGINYVFINIVTLAIFLLDIGKNYTKKTKFYASLVVSVVILLVLLLFNNAISSSQNTDKTMPIIAMVYSSKKYIKFLIKICVWFALFSTLVSNVFILSNYTCNFIKNKHLNIVLILLAGMCVGLCGFDVIVNYIYSVIGMVGIVVVLEIFIKEKETKIIVSNFKK